MAARQALLLLPLLLLLALGWRVPFSRAGPPILSLVPTECGRYFTWQASSRKQREGGRGRAWTLA